MAETNPKNMKWYLKALKISLEMIEGRKEKRRKIGTILLIGIW